MKRHIKWLIAEIDGWVNAGIIAPDQGQAIKKRYPIPEQGPAWGRIIFFSIGAILFGLGVILLFAYNWQRMPKWVKLAVIFAALIGAHGAGFRLRRPQHLSAPAVIGHQPLMDSLRHRSLFCRAG